MSSRKCHTLLHVVKHLAYMRERVVLRVAHHRVMLALRNLAHVVALLNLHLRFGHFLLAFI